MIKRSQNLKREGRGESWSKWKWKCSLYPSQTIVPRPSGIRTNSSLHRIHFLQACFVSGPTAVVASASCPALPSSCFVRLAPNEPASPYLHDCLNSSVAAMDLSNLRHQMRCSACISVRPLVTAAPFVVAAGVVAEGGATVTVGGDGGRCKWDGSEGSAGGNAQRLN